MPRKLRKRKWAKKKQPDILSIVWKDMYEAVPEFTTTRVGPIEKRKDGKRAQGRWTDARGRTIADWELDVEKERGGTDMMVKVYIWGKKRRIGETYRVSISRSEMVAGKLAEWVYKHIYQVKRGRY